MHCNCPKTCSLCAPYKKDAPAQKQYILIYNSKKYPDSTWMVSAEERGPFTRVEDAVAAAQRLSEKAQYLEYQVVEIIASITTTTEKVTVEKAVTSVKRF